MRFVRYAILAIIAIALIIIALANREPVSLRLVPAELGRWVGLDFAVQLPVFIAILAGVMIGLLLGFVWEWIREMRIRAEANQQKRENRALKGEVNALKKQVQTEGDDILALIDKAG